VIFHVLLVFTLDIGIVLGLCMRQGGANPVSNRVHQHNARCESVIQKAVTDQKNNLKSQHHEVMV